MKLKSRKHIRTKFEITIYFSGDTPSYANVIVAFKNCGIPIDGYYPSGSLHRVETHIDREKKFSLESMSRRLALLPYAIINVLEDSYIHPFVTVRVSKPANNSLLSAAEVRLFTINYDYEIDYILDTGY